MAPSRSVFSRMRTSLDHEYGSSGRRDVQNSREEFSETFSEDEDFDGTPLEQERSRALQMEEITEANLTPGQRRERAQRMVLVYVSLVLGVCAFTWLGKTLSFVFTPLLAAWFICHLILPVVNWLEKRHISRTFGYLVALGAVVSLFYGVGVMIATSVAQFRSNIGAYKSNLDGLLIRLSDYARSVGLIRSNERLELAEIFESLPMGGALSLISGGTTFAYQTVAFVTATLFTLIFMMWESERFNRRVHLAYGNKRAEKILRVIRIFNEDMGRYVLLKVFISLLTGGAAYVVMARFGLDFAPILAVLVFLLNFIPYIGSVLSTIAPLIVSLLQFPTMETPLIICGTIVLIHQIFGNVIEPKIQGRSLNISPVVILVTMVYFGWMWGIVGMIVSVPLTAGILLILQQFPLTRSFALMMRDV